MTWQEPIVALVVGLAVVSLYRQVRGMIGIGKPGEQQACHGCDDCGDDATPVTPMPENAQRPSR